jgi:hypothetical protein
LLSVTSCRYI